MSDQHKSIFALWSREEKLREAGKWAEGAPGLVVDGSRRASTGEWLHRDGHDERCYCSPVTTAAAMWRIVQLVAWAGEQHEDVHRDEYTLTNDYGACPWWTMTHADWIAEASAVIERMEGK